MIKGSGIMVIDKEGVTDNQSPRVLFTAIYDKGVYQVTPFSRHRMITHIQNSPFDCIYARIS